MYFYCMMRAITLRWLLLKGRQTKPKGGYQCMFMGQWRTTLIETWHQRGSDRRLKTRNSCKVPLGKLLTYVDGDRSMGSYRIRWDPSSAATYPSWCPRAHERERRYCSVTWSISYLVQHPLLQYGQHDICRTPNLFLHCYFFLFFCFLHLW